MKKKTLFFLIIIIILIGIVFCVVKFTKGSAFVKNDGISKTKIGKKTTSYKLDLRIDDFNGSKRINKIITVQNYKNTEKDITINDIVDSKTTTTHYFVKDSKYYELKNGKLKEVDKVKYDNTDIYIQGISSVKKLKKLEDKSIGERKFSRYEGIISSDVMNDILNETDINYKASSDVKVEIWYDSEGYIYKIYYRIKSLTVYASFFGYNQISKIDLSEYK